MCIKRRVVCVVVVFAIIGCARAPAPPDWVVETARQEAAKHWQVEKLLRAPARSWQEYKGPVHRHCYQVEFLCQPDKSARQKAMVVVDADTGQVVLAGFMGATAADLRQSR